MAKHTITLKSYTDVFNEYDAVSAITPGMLIEYTSAGKVQAHSNAGQNAFPMFAIEDALQGKDIDEAYAANDKVRCWHAQPGDEVYAILNDGETIVKGDFLESAGNGNLQKHVADIAEGGSSAETVTDTTIYSKQIVAQALEAMDLASSSGEESSGPLGYDKRIKVRIV
jgi:hypothetical protein